MRKSANILERKSEKRLWVNLTYSNIYAWMLHKKARWANIPRKNNNDNSPKIRDVLKVCGKRLFTSIASPKNELEERERDKKCRWERNSF